MPRAGWAGGMLSAPKLYQSVSISGPSATSKPMPTKTSSSSSRVWDTRWRWPRAGGPAHRAGDELGQVEPVAAISAGTLRRSGSRSRSASMSASTVAPGLVQPPARAPRGRRGRATRARGEAWASGDFLPDTAVVTARMASVVSAAAMAARASATRPSTSQRRPSGARPSAPPPSRLRRIVVPAIHVPHGRHRRAAGGHGRAVATPGPALAEGLEAQHGGGHAHVERLGPPGHRDRDRLVEPVRPGRRSSPEASLPSTTATRRVQSKAA